MQVFENNIFPENQIQRLPRGRKPFIDQDLAKRLENLRPGFAIKLSKSFGSISPEKRNQISTLIRKHWIQVRDDKPSISYTEDGIPIVSVSLISPASNGKSIKK